MTYRSGAMALLLPLLLLMASCSKSYDHAKYIPKDALMVAELNTKSLSKKIAWSMITGSKLLDQLKSRSLDSLRQSDIVKNIADAGIDELNTYYAYLKNDGGNDKVSCFVALIPLKDAGKWESFLQQNIKDIKIKSLDKRKEALLYDDLYAGWTKDILIVVAVKEKEDYMHLTEEETGADVAAASSYDEAMLASYLETAFSVSKENSLLEDKRFHKFEESNNDLGFWVNIDAVMNSYGSKNLAGLTGGFQLSNTMWKDAAFTAGTNFEKGKVVTDLTVYSSDSLAAINKEFAQDNMDKDALERLPAKSLDYLLAYHLSPGAMQKTLDRLGVSELANSFLSQDNLSIGEILQAITGDLVFAVNNFAQEKETILFDPSDPTSAINTYKTRMDVVFALKIKNKETFNKILGLGLQNGLIVPVGADAYMIQSPTAGPDTAMILLNDKYMVFANKGNVGRGYLDGPKQQLAPLVRDNVSGKPFGMVFDFREWSQGIAPMMNTSPEDSMMFQYTRNTFDNYILNGGTFENNAFKYQMTVNLMDKGENSLLQLINYAQQMKEVYDRKAMQTASAIQ